MLSGAGVALAARGGNGARASEDANRVAAGLYPLAFAAERVGGPDVEVQNLTPPGVEPHDLEVSADDARALEAADLVLLLGRDFQPQLEASAQAGDATVVELLDVPGLGVSADGDPHVWLDPLRYATLARAIAGELGDPRAAAPLVRELRRLDREYRRGLAHCRHDQLVTSHDAFGYLARRYGLHQIAITGLEPEAEPSPADLAAVIDRVRASGARTVFAETLLSRRLADTVARETGAEDAVLNPIEGLTSAQAERGEDYFSLMRDNLAALREGLGCR